MDLGFWGSIGWNGEFLSGLASIALVDIVLAGDNAVVIALAVQSLPVHLHRKGILLGSAAAVILRVFFTFLAAGMLHVPLLKLLGGLMIVWIAAKLLGDENERELHGRPSGGLWQAVWMIAVADLTMSLDNMLAVSGASHGNLVLLLFGLGLSIPLVVFASSLLSGLMVRYPAIIWIGAAVLGKIAVDLIITDPYVHQRWQPAGQMEQMLQLAGALGIVFFGLARRRLATAPAK